MAGRARGRGRGRGVATDPSTAQPPPPEVAPPVQAAAGPPLAGRARGRGRGSALAQTSQPVPSPESAAQVAAPAPENGAQGPPPGIGRQRGGGQQQARNGDRPLEDRMGAMNIGARGDGREERYRRDDDETFTSSSFIDKKIDPATIQGKLISLVGNAVCLYPQERALTEPTGYQYHVDFLPPLDHKGTRIALVKSKKEMLGGSHILYDGGSTLYTCKKVGASDVIELEATRERDQSTVKMIFTFKSQIFATSGEFQRILGLLMKKALRQSGLTQLGPHHFLPEKQVPLTDSFYLWPGYTTGVNAYQGGLMLVMNTTFKLAHQRSVYQEMGEIFQRVRGDTNAFQRECQTKFIGTVIVTTYNMKRYKIDDIDFDQNPASTFERRSGPVNFADYFREKYNCEVSDMQQPLLLSRGKERERREREAAGLPQQDFLLIPEFCIVTGLSDDLRNNFHFMREMAKTTQQQPQLRATKLMDLVKTFREKEEILNNFRFWHLDFSQSLVQFSGKQLRGVDILLHGDRPISYDSNMGDFQRAIRGRLRHPMEVSKYAIIYSQRDERNAISLNQHLTGEVGSGFGMSFGQVVTYPCDNPRTQAFAAALQRCLAEHNGSLKLVICVLPDNAADRYAAIKRMCYVENPVPSQCVLGKTLMKNTMSVVSKIAVQINAKLGGVCWLARMPPSFAAQIIGMDVHHPGRGMRGPSTVGIVGSINKDVTRYHSRCFTNADEIISCIKTGFISCVTAFRNATNIWPPKIIFFRDGVGEGQLRTVATNELKVVEEALQEMECDSKICFVVVSKRIQQRFFANQNGSLVNPPSGTVAFDTLTKKDRYDFFLVPQGTRQGTVTPTHYNVLHDNTGIKEFDLMTIAYNCCHLYYNWTGAVKVPAVCQYAHKLAFLAGTSLGQGEPHPKLHDTLFYL